MKKILVIVILLLTTIGCELFDAKTWEEAEEREKERGHTCYRDYYGSFHCRDRYSD